MIWLAGLAWASDPGLPADPGCGLASCPVGYEARTCRDDINMDGECSRLESHGWKRACTLATRDKPGWALVVCRPPTPPDPPPSRCGGCATGDGGALGALALAALSAGRTARRLRRAG